MTEGSTGRWKWEVSGMQDSGSPGAARHALEASGTCRAELMGAVVEWLAQRGPFWGVLDEDEPVTFTISRLEE